MILLLIRAKKLSKAFSPEDKEYVDLIVASANLAEMGYGESAEYAMSMEAYFEDADYIIGDFDEVIPAEYQQYSDEIDCDHGLALVLAADESGITIRRTGNGEPGRLPQGPQFLAWLQSDDAALELTAEQQTWRWQR